MCTYESREEDDKNLKELNLGLLQLEFIASIQVYHLVCLLFYNSLPKEELCFWSNTLHSNLSCLFVINVRIALVTKWKTIFINLFPLYYLFYLLFWYWKKNPLQQDSLAIQPNDLFHGNSQATLWSCQFVKVVKSYKPRTGKIILSPKWKPTLSLSQQSLPKHLGHIGSLDLSSHSTICFSFRVLIASKLKWMFIPFTRM